MGNCTSENKINIEYDNLNNNNKLIGQILPDSTDIEDLFTFKNYREYDNRMKIFKYKIKDYIFKINFSNYLKLNQTSLLYKTKNINTLNINNKQHYIDYNKLNKEDKNSIKEKVVYKRILNSKLKQKKVLNIDNLYYLMLRVFHKIVSVYTNSFCFPKQELDKITYDLLSRYNSYAVLKKKANKEFDNESIDNNDDYESNYVVSKVISRLNYFVDDFPFKIKRIKKIITTKRIFAFGYDNLYRICFYIKPKYNTEVSIFDNIELSNNFIRKKNMNISNKSIASVSSDKVVNLSKNSDNKFKRKSKNKTKSKLNKLDYIIYIFFVIEFVLPSLIDIYNFSDEINIYIDHENSDVDIELISIILHFMSLHYPLRLNTIYAANFITEEKSLRKNMVNQIKEVDIFKCVKLCDQDISLKLFKNFNPNCIPSEYGGYYNINNNSFDKIEFIEDLIEVLLQNILIKECI